MQSESCFYADRWGEGMRTSLIPRSEPATILEFDKEICDFVEYLVIYLVLRGYKDCDFL